MKYRIFKGSVIAKAETQQENMQLMEMMNNEAPTRPVPVTRIFACDSCDFVAQNAAGLGSHKRIHRPRRSDLHSAK